MIQSETAGVVGMLVTAYTVTPIVISGFPERLRFDSILAFAATIGHDEDLPPPKAETMRVIEIPGVRCLWRDEAGKPLWAITDLYPEGQKYISREYKHRRYPTHRVEFGKKLNASKVAGPYKERRSCIKTIMADRWVGAIIGNQNRVIELLDKVSHIGSHTAAGFGRVARWTVQATDEVDIKFILSRRNVPIASGLIQHERPVMGPWTPPAWFCPWHCAVHEGRQQW